MPVITDNEDLITERYASYQFFGVIFGSHFSQLPALMYIAECAKGNTDEEKIKAKFKRIVGVDYDDFMKTDIPNYVNDTPAADHSVPSKAMLYSDPFLGFLDYTVSDGVGKI